MKTISLKKVSAVAVASLGFGLLSVVPAQAASGLGTVTVSGGSTTVFVGDVAKMSVNVTTSAAAAGTQAADEVITLTIANTTTVTDATALTIADAVAHNAAAVASSNVHMRMPGASNTGNTSVSTVLVPSINTGTTPDKIIVTPATSAAAGTYNAGSLEFKANTPGQYVFTVTPSTPGAEDTQVAGTFTVNVVSVGGTIGDGGAVASPFSAVNGVAGEFNYVTLKASGMSRTTGALGTQYVVTGSTFISASGQTLSEDKTKFTIAGITHATNAGTDSTVLVATKAAGTITVKSYVETAAGIYSTTATDTVTITVAAAVVAGIYAGQTVYMNTSTTTPSASSDATTATTAPIAAATASDTPVANIEVYQKDGQSTPVDLGTTATKAIVYEISGAGALGTANNQRLGSYIAVAAGSANGNDVFIFPDGRSGVGTITVKVNGVLVATKKVNFYGSATSYTAVVKKQHVPNSGSQTSGVIEVTVKDANGVVVPSHTVYASVGTSDKATISSTGVSNSSGVATFAATGVATKFGAVTATFSNAATSAATTFTTTATFGVSSVLAKTLTITTDKATYAPGEKITFTLTAKDANGLGLPDGNYAAGALLASAATNPVISTGIGTTPFIGNAGIDLVAGVGTAVAYAPLQAGTLTVAWTLRGTLGDTSDSTNLVAALQGTTVTASAKVSQNSDITAITTQIDALNAKIVALNALIAKIMKKLGVR